MSLGVGPRRSWSQEAPPFSHSLIPPKGGPTGELAFPLLGLGTGAAYAAIAVGLVLTYRASAVVNFAHGAMAMYAAYVYVELRTTGDLVLPGVPGHLHLAGAVPFVVALAISLTVAAGLGLLVHLVVFRPLREAAPLTRVVASVGLMITLQAVTVLQFGTENRSVPSVLPTFPLHLFDVAVPVDRVVLAALVVGAGAVLATVSRRTRFGVLSRAVAEDRTGVALLGHSPEAVAGVSWALAGVVAAAGGIAVGPVTALNPTSYTLLVVPALAAALVGRLSSFGATVAAGLTLGMAQAEVTRLQAGLHWLPRLGLRDGLPLLVIVVAMAVGGAVPPPRPSPVRPRLPSAGRPAHPVAVAATLIAGAVAMVATLPAPYRLGLITSMVGAVVCLSLVVVTGYAGQVSLAQMAFAGLGGFALARLGMALGIPFPLTPLLAAALAAVAGLALGLPALRLRGENLAVVTLAGAVVVEELVFKNRALTGGFQGTRVRPPSLFGVDLGIGGKGAQYPRPAFALLVVVVLAATALGVARLRSGSLGRRWLAVRANERAALVAGVDATRAKLAAFALSAFVAGLAGAFIGYQQGQLSFDSFGVFVSLSYLAVATVGGIAGIGGALVGGALAAGGIVSTLVDRLAHAGRYQLLVSGLGLVAVAVLAPDGLAGLGARLGRRLGRRLAAAARNRR